MKKNALEEVNIIGISGSLRSGSYTRKSIEISLDGAKNSGAHIEMLDLRNYDLPYCTGEDIDDTEGLMALKNKIKNAQGIILGTPEYHGSLSGVLKNMLDLMGFDEFEGKMIGLIGTSGGSLGAISALNSLRAIGRSLHAWVIPNQVTIPESHMAFDKKTGILKNKKYHERLVTLGEQVAKFAHMHNESRYKEFLQGWVNMPQNPGGDGR